MPFDETITVSDVKGTKKGWNFKIFNFINH